MKGIRIYRRPFCAWDEWRQDELHNLTLKRDGMMQEITAMNPRTITWVAMLNRKPVAWGIRDRDGVCMVYTQPKLRRKGIGKKILARIIEDNKRQHRRKVIVLPHDGKSRKFFLYFSEAVVRDYSYARY